MSSCDAHFAGLNKLLDVVVYTDMYLLLRVQGCCRRLDQGHFIGEHAGSTLNLLLHADRLPCVTASVTSFCLPLHHCWVCSALTVDLQGTLNIFFPPSQQCLIKILVGQQYKSCFFCRHVAAGYDAGLLMVSAKHLAGLIPAAYICSSRCNTCCARCNGCPATLTSSSTDAAPKADCVPAACHTLAAVKGMMLLQL